MPHRIPIISDPSQFPSHLAILNGAPSFDDVFAMSTQINAEWVRSAYMRGLFPWYSEGMPVFWHSPNPRMVLPIADFKYSPSLKKRLKQWARQDHIGMRVTLNHAFESVISACANIPRHDQEGTWITDELRAAYVDLHRQQAAISVEVWQDDALKAGLYGVLIGKMFFGESMFTTITDGSKVALACWVEYLRRHDCTLIDCQQETRHLTHLGGAPISREAFFVQSAQLMQQPALDFAAMQLEDNLLDSFR